MGEIAAAEAAHGGRTRPFSMPARRRGVAVIAAVVACFVGGCAGAPPPARQASPPLPALPAIDTARIPIAGGAIPTPASILGYEPAAYPERREGEPDADDARSPRWAEVTRYFEVLARVSARVRVDTIGRSTGGRPFIVATVASPSTLEDLDLYRSVQQRFADPRRVGSADEVERMMAGGRTVVMLAGTGRADERDGPVASLVIAHRLATVDAPLERTILANTITLIVPSMNPDGFDRVAEWLRDDDAGDGPPTGGDRPPFLEHEYAGRDLRADVPGLTQVETRLIVERIVREWKPHAVHLLGGSGDGGGDDEGALGLRGPQGPLPGPQGPWPAHFSPLAAGSTPSPGPARTMSGTVSGTVSATHADAVAFALTDAFTLLETAATRRDRWLRRAWDAAHRAVHVTTETSDSVLAAWTIADASDGVSPAQASDPTAYPSVGLPELLRIMSVAGIELRRVSSPYDVGGRHLAAGTYVVPARQPLARLARALLAENGEALPLLLGVDVSSIMLADGDIRDLLESTRPVARVPAPPRVAPTLTGAGTAAPRVAVYRSRVPAPAMDASWTRWLLDAYRIPHTTIRDEHVRRGSLDDRVDVVIMPEQHPDTIYAGHPPGTVSNARAGGLGAEGTAELAAFVRDGGTLVTLGRASGYAAEYLGIPVRDRRLDVQAVCADEGDESDADDGPAAAGSSARGDSSARAPSSPSATRLPPAVVSLAVDTAHTLARGLAGPVRAWARGALDLEPTHAAAEAVARYGDDVTTDCRTGGYALVSVPVGAGRVVAFGFRPHRRGLATTTLPLFFNALRAAGQLAR